MKMLPVDWNRKFIIKFPRLEFVEERNTLVWIYNIFCECADNRRERHIVTLKIFTSTWEAVVAR